MENSFHSLSEKIRLKTEQERQNTEEILRENFNSLSQSLRASSKDALHTTQNAILHELTSLEQHVSSRCQSMKQTFSQPFQMLLIWCIAILLVTALAIVGFISLNQSRFQSLEAQVAQLQEKKKALEQTVATWPLQLVELPDGRFLVPKGPHTIKGGWELDKQPAWKLE